MNLLAVPFLLHLLSALEPAPPQTTGWQQLFSAPSGARDVATDALGNVLLTTTNGRVWHLRAGASVWSECSYYTGTEVGGLGDSQYPYSIAFNGTVALCTDKVGHVRRESYPPAAENRWNSCGAFEAKDVAVTKSGTRWMVNASGKIYRAPDCSNWEQVSGSDGRRIAAGQDRVWLVNSVGKIYKWNGNGWTQMQGSSVADVAVGNDGTVWCTNTDGAIFKFNGLGWNRLAGSDASRIAADAGSVWMVNTAGKLYRMYY
ncbi:MAG: hypothetical protein JNL43_13470 [Flavobacteriales bacterium]|nr:hypothetical protein [Flavobacteriales bacterium]